MKKEKLKSPPRKQGRSFVLLWSLSYAALWMILFTWMFLTSNSSAIRSPSLDMLGSLGVFMTAGLVALTQQRLLQRLITGWVLFSLLGTLFTFGLFNSAFGMGTLDNTMLIPSLALLVPTSLVQMVWLSRHVKSAWLWPLTNIVAAMSFAFIFRDNNISAMGLGIIGLGLLQGIVQAVVMRYLWFHAGETEKSKQQSLVEDIENRKAVERLTLNETAQDIIDDRLLLQQQRQ